MSCGAGGAPADRFCGAAGGIGARHVGGVALDLGAEIGEQSVRRARSHVVGLVVERVARPPATIDRNAGQQTPRRRRRLLRFNRDVDRALNQRQLRVALDLAPREEDRRRVADPHFRIPLAQLLGEPLLARRPAARAAMLQQQPDVRGPAGTRRRAPARPGARTMRPDRDRPRRCRAAPRR